MLCSKAWSGKGVLRPPDRLAVECGTCVDIDDIFKWLTFGKYLDLVVVSSLTLLVIIGRESPGLAVRVGSI